MAFVLTMHTLNLSTLHVNWVCDPCYKEMSALKKFKAEMEEFKNDLREMISQVV